MNTMQRRKSPRQSVRLLSLALAGALFAGQVQAQWIVNDPLSMGKAMMEYAEQAKRWTDTLAQYQKELAHYQQMIASVSNLNFASLLPTNPLSKISESDVAKMQEQACPGPGGVAGVISSVTGFNLNGNIAQNQQQICQHIVSLQVKKYNDTVDMMGRLVQYNNVSKQIEDLRNAVPGSSSAIGNMGSNTNESTRAQNKVTIEMSNWRAQMEVYSSAIETLEKQQSILAKAALSGKGSLLGNVVQATAFAAAFSDN